MTKKIAASAAGTILLLGVAAPAVAADYPPSPEPTTTSTPTTNTATTPQTGAESAAVLGAGLAALGLGGGLIAVARRRSA